MKAIKATLNAKDKIALNKVVPLDSPLFCTIEPSGLCNLKCGFCLLSLPIKELEKKGHAPILMSDETFNMLLKQLSCFPSPLKTVVFARLGEPLLNKRLPSMISELKQRGLCQKTLVITNGIPLTHEMSDALVAAGLDTIKFSINGLSADDYLHNCGIRVDYEKLINEMTYLYKNKKGTKIQVKILDKCLGDDFEKGKDKFYSLFGDICDEISIERLFPMFGKEIAYDEMYFSDTPSPTSRYENNRAYAKVCATPFYKLSIAANGQVEYCFSRGIAAGSLYDMTLFEMWNSHARKEVLLNLLDGCHEGITSVCKTCGCSKDSVDENDNLDPYAHQIKERLLQKT